MTDKSKFLTPKDADITFKCDGCTNVWDGPPLEVIDDDTLSHPYRYFASCPVCAERSQQIAWQRGLFSSYVKSTGPKTAQGKQSSAANLIGHPTPEEAQRTRFNSMKHGASAKTALYFPAKPDGYSFCGTCDVDRDYCASQIACQKRTELFMRHLIAMESGDPKMLRDMHAMQQANLSAMFDDMLLSIIQEGVLLKTPAFSFDKDGGFHLAKYIDDNGNPIQIMDAKANPLLKHVMDLMSKNNMSLADLGMTNKVQSDQDIDMGRIRADEQDKESLIAVADQGRASLDLLREQIARSREDVKKDPVLIEYNEQQGDG